MQRKNAFNFILTNENIHFFNNEYLIALLFHIFLARENWRESINKKQENLDTKQKKEYTIYFQRKFRQTIAKAWIFALFALAGWSWLLLPWVGTHRGGVTGQSLSVY